MNDSHHPLESPNERRFSLTKADCELIGERTFSMLGEAASKKDSTEYLICTRASSLAGDPVLVPSDVCHPSSAASSVWLACKRAIDFVLALVALIVLAPFLAIVAMAIWLQDGGNPLFPHERVGQDLRPFGCLKFRTMRPDAKAKLEELLRTDPVARLEWKLLHKLKSDPRVTPFGRFLRSSSIDELPQLINVLKGEMSIVGPRPITRSEAVRYGWRIADYSRARPGLTGIWQVSGRNAVPYRRRVAMDVIYVRNSSLILDCQIIAKTIPALLRAEGR